MVSFACKRRCELTRAAGAHRGLFLSREESTAAMGGPAQHGFARPQSDRYSIAVRIGRLLMSPLHRARHLCGAPCDARSRRFHRCAPRAASRCSRDGVDALCAGSAHMPRHCGGARRRRVFHHSLDEGASRPTHQYTAHARAAASDRWAGEARCLFNNSLDGRAFCRLVGSLGRWRCGSCVEAVSYDLCFPRRARQATWLILPVVICLSQRLSHACLSISDLYCETANGSLNQLWFL